MRRALYEKAVTEEQEVYDWLKEHFKSRMRKLYDDLEQEYDYLTSDDVVWDSIVANELDKEQEDDDETADETREAGAQYVEV